MGRKRKRSKQFLLSIFMPPSSYIQRTRRVLIYFLSKWENEIQEFFTRRKEEKLLKLMPRNPSLDCVSQWIFLISPKSSSTLEMLYFWVGSFRADQGPTLNLLTNYKWNLKVKKAKEHFKLYFMLFMGFRARTMKETKFLRLHSATSSKQNKMDYCYFPRFSKVIVIWRHLWKPSLLPKSKH